MKSFVALYFTVFTLSSVQSGHCEDGNRYFVVPGYSRRTRGSSSRSIVDRESSYSKTDLVLYIAAGSTRECYLTVGAEDDASSRPQRWWGCGPKGKNVRDDQVMHVCGELDGGQLKNSLCFSTESFSLVRLMAGQAVRVACGTKSCQYSQKKGQEVHKLKLKVSTTVKGPINARYEVTIPMMIQPMRHQAGNDRLGDLMFHGKRAVYPSLDLTFMTTTTLGQTGNLSLKTDSGKIAVLHLKLMELDADVLLLPNASNAYNAVPFALESPKFQKPETIARQTGIIAVTWQKEGLGLRSRLTFLDNPGDPLPSDTIAVVLPGDGIDLATDLHDAVLVSYGDVVMSIDLGSTWVVVRTDARQHITAGRNQIKVLAFRVNTSGGWAFDDQPFDRQSFHNILPEVCSLGLQSHFWVVSLAGTGSKYLHYGEVLQKSFPKLDSDQRTVEVEIHGISDPLPSILPGAGMTYTGMRRIVELIDVGLRAELSPSLAPKLLVLPGSDFHPHLTQIVKAERLPPSQVLIKGAATYGWSPTHIK